jgi:hypothetical protein
VVFQESLIFNVFLKKPSMPRHIVEGVDNSGLRAVGV